MDDGFEVCWKCQQPKPAPPVRVEEKYEPSEDWSGNFREILQPDGSLAVAVFGRDLICAVCGNASFRRHTALVNSGPLFMTSSAIHFVCSQCGHVLWFLPQKRR